MTPPDKPGSTGQNPESESDRPSGVATDGPAEQATGGGHETNGESTTDQPTTRIVGADDLELSHGTPPPWQRVPSESAKSTPPGGSPSLFTDSKASAAPGSAPGSTPSAASSGPDFTSGPDFASAAKPPSLAPTPPPANQPGQRTMPVTPSGSPGETTVSVERPIVTGAAAARLFADGSMPSASTIPHAGTTAASAGQNRTTVHLDGSNPSTGPLRIGAAATPSALRRPGRGPRRANLQIKRFDPWSVLKLSLVLSVALFFVWLVAVGVLYAVLDGMGVWDKLNGISSEILQPADDGGGTEPLISAGRVFGVAAIIGAVNIVLFSALATVGAFIYNVSADLAGGLEVTLAERE